MRRVLPLLLFFAGCCALAQDCAQTVPTIILNEETRLFVPALTAERLHVKIGSIVAPVTSVEPITRFRVLILIDASGSMEPLEKPMNRQRRALEMVSRTLDEFLDQLPQGVSMEYGMFNNFAVFGPGFTADAQQLRSSLADIKERLKHRGSKRTALYDALRDGLERFDSPHPGDSILVLTDGLENESRSKAGKIQEEAASKGVRLFTVLFHGNEPDIEGSVLEIPNFAERTGGSVHVIDATSDLWIGGKGPEQEKQDLLRFMTNEVLSSYLLRFNTPTGKKKSKWLLSVDRLPGQKYKIVAAYPSRLNACPLTTAAAH
jgi:hypothetical protein